MRKFKIVLALLLCFCTFSSLIGCSIAPNRIKNEQQTETTNKDETVEKEEDKIILPKTLATYASHHMGKVTDITNDYFISDGYLYYFRPSGEIEEIRKVNGDTIIYAGNQNRLSTGLKEHIFITKDENGRQFVYNNRKTEDLDCSGIDFTNLMNIEFKDNEFILTYNDGSKTTYKYEYKPEENIQTLDIVNEEPAPTDQPKYLQPSLRLNKYEFKVKDENTLLHQSFADSKEREFLLPNGITVNDIKVMAYSQEANYRVFIQTKDEIYYYNNKTKDYTFKLHEELTNVYKENPDMKLGTITLMNANRKTYDSILVMVNNTIYMYNDPELNLK